MQTLLAIVFVFGSAIFFHELGHFTAAKLSGILVREFAIGFGPKIFSFKKGETRYTLRLFPLGGFVRMAGEEPETIELKKDEIIGLKIENNLVTKIYTDKIAKSELFTGKLVSYDIEDRLIISIENDEKIYNFPLHEQALIINEKEETQIAPHNRQFQNKSLCKRFLTIFAGPFMNFILAVIFFTSVTMNLGIPTNVIKIDSVKEGLPAQQAGFRSGDIILQVNDLQISSKNALISTIQSSLNKELIFSIKRESKIIKIKVKPIKTDQGVIIGANLTNEYEKVSVFRALQSGLYDTYTFSKEILNGFKQLIFGNVSFNDMAGPIGIMQVTGEAASYGFIPLLRWAAILSLYLGIFNLLPIPALDGSRLMFIIIESFRGKPLDQKKEGMVHLVGFALLMILMVLVTINDITRLLNKFL